MISQKMHLRELVRALGWSYGTLWSMSNLTTELTFADGCFEPNFSKKFDSEYFDVERQFTSAYKSCSFPLGSGYVGKVLKEGQPLWRTETRFLMDHSNTPSQARFFKVAGIQTMLCIPWFDSVIELGSSTLLPENTNLLGQIQSFLLLHMATSTSKQQRTNACVPMESSFVSQDFSAGSDDASFNGGLNPDQHLESGSTLAKISVSSRHRSAAAEHHFSHGEVVAGSGDESDWRLEFESDELLHPKDVASSQSPSRVFRRQRLQHEVNEVDFDSSFLMCPRQQMPLLSQLEYNHSMSTSHSSSRGDDTNNLLSASNGNSEQQSDNDQSSPQNDASRNLTAASGFKPWSATARSSSMSGVHRSGSHSNQAMLWRSIKMTEKIPQMKGSREGHREQTHIAAVRHHAASAAEEVLSGHDEASKNHMMAERRRRLKQKENFTALRALIPFVSKLDRASILGDAITYVKQLTARVEELELLNRELEAQLPAVQRKRSRSSTITSL